MKINIGNVPLSGKSVGGTWAELYSTYAQTIIDDGKKIMNAGIILKLNRALAGAYANANGLNYVSQPNPNRNTYLLTNGNLQYGYSANFDKINNKNSFATNRKSFLQNSYYGVSADIGFEYLSLLDAMMKMPIISMT